MLLTWTVQEATAFGRAASGRDRVVLAGFMLFVVARLLSSGRSGQRQQIARLQVTAAADAFKFLNNKQVLTNTTV